MLNLTTDQLKAQAEAINVARHLMENSYNTSQSTINELMAAFKLIDAEIASRRNANR